MPIPFMSRRLDLTAFRMLAEMDPHPGIAVDWLQEENVGLPDVALLFGQGADLRQDCSECAAFASVDDNCRVCHGTGQRPLWQLPQSALAEYVGRTLRPSDADCIRSFHIGPYRAGMHPPDYSQDWWSVIWPNLSDEPHDIPNSHTRQGFPTLAQADRVLRRAVLEMPLFRDSSVLCIRNEIPTRHLKSGRPLSQIFAMAGFVTDRVDWLLYIAETLSPAGDWQQATCFIQTFRPPDFVPPEPLPSNAVPTPATEWNQEVRDFIAAENTRRGRFAPDEVWENTASGS